MHATLSIAEAFIRPDKFIVIPACILQHFAQKSKHLFLYKQGTFLKREKMQEYASAFPP